MQESIVTNEFSRSVAETVATSIHRHLGSKNKYKLGLLLAHHTSSIIVCSEEGCHTHPFARFDETQTEPRVLGLRR